MNIAVVGFDVEGRASYEYWTKLAHSVTICDQNPVIQIPEGADSQLGSDYLQNLARFDLIVRTPGLHPANIITHNPGIEDKITSGTNEFLAVCPTRNIIGITGTKGKGTTSSLITKMLEAAGKTVHLGGNIGRAALDMLPDIQPDDWVVLELSNFQLIDIKHAPHIAVCLMMVPEHLDWHETAQEYFEAKQQLFKHQTTGDTAIYFADNAISKQTAETSPGTHIPFYALPGALVDNDAIVIDGQSVCHTGELKLLGEHNWQNACAAVTAMWQVEKNIEAMRQVLTTFSGLEHRLEFVRDINGTSYYNDSFGTTPETAMVAIQAFKEPKVVILGGSDKGAHYAALADTVRNGNVRAVLTIGDTGSDIQGALEVAGYTNVRPGGDTMQAIVQKAHELAQPGDVVLLSTGCASFGMFKNYKDRGEQFKQAVQNLS